MEQNGLMEPEHETSKLDTVYQQMTEIKTMFPSVTSYNVERQKDIS